RQRSPTARMRRDMLVIRAVFFICSRSKFAPTEVAPPAISEFLNGVAHFADLTCGMIQNCAEHIYYAWKANQIDERSAYARLLLLLQTFLLHPLACLCYAICTRLKLAPFACDLEQIFEKRISPASGALSGVSLLA